MIMLMIVGCDNQNKKIIVNVIRIKIKKIVVNVFGEKWKML